MNHKTVAELNHPGFILFEGVDFTGKSIVANEIVHLLQERFELNAKYSHNRGFLNGAVVDSNKLKNMTRMEKENYILQCYLRDTLPTEPREFVEIIQDRHIPSIIFYSTVFDKLDVEITKPFIEKTIKPKYIFLLEANHESRVKRAANRDFLTSLEKLGLSSSEINQQFLDTYRQVIELLKVPYTTINTTELSVKEVTSKCLEKIIELDLLMHTVSVEGLVFDFEPRVYPSTVGLRYQEIQRGEALKPITITRKIDKKGRYVDVVIDGRHRAYASSLAKAPQIKAYVNYEPVDDIGNLKLWALEEFDFK